MKTLSLLVLFFAATAFAQTTSVKDIPADSETTISISKGSKSTPEYTITDGSAEIEGDPEILINAGRSSWKKACDEWKKEIKDLNKQNQVLAISCNSSVCAKNENSATVCKSTGTYKLKIQTR